MVDENGAKGLSRFQTFKENIKSLSISVGKYILSVVYGLFKLISIIILSFYGLKNGLLKPVELPRFKGVEISGFMSGLLFTRNIFLYIWDFIKLPFSIISNIISTYLDLVHNKIEEIYPGGNKNNDFQNVLFWFILLLISLMLFLQPTAANQRFFIFELLLTTCIFSMMALALNLQTGLTGVVNFGVIFFVGIGAVTTAVLSTKYGVSPLTTMFIGMLISGTIGFLLAYPSLKLRTDYFAIVTITLGEFLRLLLNVEPYFGTKNVYGGTNVGILNVSGPLKDYYRRNFYIVFLGLLSLFFLILMYFIVNKLTYSPYGRILKAIREDEDVVEAYGYNVFYYKASVLAIGGALFAIPGSFIAWKDASVYPGTIAITTTFFVWAAFIIGGKGNSKGMIIGGTIIAFSNRWIRGLSEVDRSESFLLSTLDSIYRWIVVDIGGFLFGDESWLYSFVNEDAVVLDLNFMQIFFIGMIIIFFLYRFEEGLIPEMPYRAENPNQSTLKEAK